MTAFPAQNGLVMRWRRRHFQLPLAVLEQGCTLMQVHTHPACPSPSLPEQPSPATACASTSHRMWRSLMRRLRARGRGGAAASAASGAARRRRPKVRTVRHGSAAGCQARLACTACFHDRAARQPGLAVPCMQGPRARPGTHLLCHPAPCLCLSSPLAQMRAQTTR